MTTTSEHSLSSPRRAGPVPRPPRREPANTAQALRALFAKEVRELLPWAALAAVLFSKGLAYALYSLAAEFREPHSPPQNTDLTGFLTPLFVGVCLFIPAIAAATFGFLQFFPETRPDRFAFLVHRPAPRSLIFLGKVLAGLAVYFVCTFVPLALAILWVKNPAHVPLPFAWEMVQAPLADIFAGVPFYLAGALAARRTDARWFGSRLLPLLAPILSSGLTAAAASLGWALLAVAIFAVILFAAARGAFLAAGQLRPTPRHARVCTAIALAVGLFLCGAFVFGILGSLIEPPSENHHSVEYRIFRDGTPVRLDMHSTRHSESVTAYTLDGQHLLLNEPYYNQNLSAMSFQPEYWPWLMHEPLAHFTRVYDATPQEQGFLPRSADYLVLFDASRKALIGAIGANRFEPDVAVPRARFTHPLVPGSAFVMLDRSPLATVALASGDSVFTVAPDHALQKIFTAPGETVRGVHTFVTSEQSDLPPAERSAGASNKAIVFTGIRTDKAIVVLDSTLKPVLRYAAADITTADIASVGYLPHRSLFVVQTVQGPAFPLYNARPAHVVFLKPATTDGGPSAVVDHALDLPAGETFAPVEPPLFAIGIPLAAPPAGLLAAIGLARYFDPASTASNSPDMIRSMTLAFSTALVIAGLIFVLARRYHFTRPQTLLWLITALAMGLMTPFLMLALAWRSPLARCPHCKKPRRADSTTCDNCGQPAPRPAPNGTEIFTPETAVPA